MTMYTMNIATRSNEDWVDSVALWLPESDGSPSAEPFPIDDTWSVIQHLRKPNEMLIPAFVCSSDNARLMIVIDENTAGEPTEVRLQWNVTREDIEHLPAGVYFHDVKLIDPTNGEIVLFAGLLTHTIGTTRP